VTLDYNPNLTFYANKNLKDSVDQSLLLSWATTLEDWQLGLTQSYATTSSPLVQTGSQTETETYSTSFTSSYRFNSYWSVDNSLTQNITAADGLSGSRSWNIFEYLNYQFFPRLTGSVGIGGGYDSVDAGPDTPHESLQLRLQWRAFDKLSLSVHGGGEVEQFVGGPSLPNLITPTYGASISYNPFENTSISLQLDRGLSPSITAGTQASDNTTLSLNLQQRLLKRLQLTVGATYGENDYIDTMSDLHVNRSDTSYSLNTQLGFTVLRRVTLSLTYTYSADNSSASGFNYSSSQAGVQVSYRY
jgi:hypothetical protein